LLSWFLREVPLRKSLAPAGPITPEGAPAAGSS
jgi:hypothetical protein